MIIKRVRQASNLMCKSETISTIRKVLAKHPFIVKAELFGSYARGDYTVDSDVDLIIHSEHNRPVGHLYYSLFLALEEELGRRVDLVQEGTLRHSVEQVIKTEREVIWEAAMDQL